MKQHDLGLVTVIAMVMLAWWLDWRGYWHGACMMLSIWWLEEDCEISRGNQTLSNEK